MMDVSMKFLVVEIKVAINSPQVLEKSNLNNLQQLLFQLQIPVVLLQGIVLFLLMKIRLFDLLLAQQLHPAVHHLVNSFKRTGSRLNLIHHFKMLANLLLQCRASGQNANSVYVR